jgi:MFS family permease
MTRLFAVVRETWTLYTPLERRNIAIYIAGIMMYKFGLEAFNGSVIALATNRYDELERTDGSITFQRIGLLTGLNQAFQCVGSILIAPLVKRWPTKNVLACAVLIFGFMSSILLILDAATGGKFRPRGHPRNDFSYYGNYHTDGMIPICKYHFFSSILVFHLPWVWSRVRTTQAFMWTHDDQLTTVTVQYDGASLMADRLRMWNCIRYGRTYQKGDTPRSCRRKRSEAPPDGLSRPYLL